MNKGNKTRQLSFSGAILSWIAAPSSECLPTPQTTTDKMRKMRAKEEGNNRRATSTLKTIKICNRLDWRQTAHIILLSVSNKCDSQQQRSR